MPVSDPSSLDSFTAAGQPFAVQTQAFVVPSLSSLSPSGSSANVTVALRSSSEYSTPTLDVRVSVPLPQLGTLGPNVVAFDAVGLAKVGQVAGYVLWEGSVVFGGVSTGGVTVEVMDDGNVVDTTLLY